MGLTRREIDQRLDSIVDFSGIEAFIDTPVKRYSSGMNARLGFAIAVHLDPDVLVIDEVLSVGDMSFQEKCVKRMQQFKRDGVAIVFVSHNMQAVGELCDEALVIKGHPRFRGEVGDAVSHYLDLSSADEQRNGGNGITATNLRLTDPSGVPVDAAEPQTPLQLHFDLTFDRDFPAQLTVGIIVRRASQTMWLYDAAYTAADLGFERLTAGQTVRMRFDHHAHLARGQYVYEVYVTDPAEAHWRLFTIAGGLRVNEYRSLHGLADLAGSLQATPVDAPARVLSATGV
jgi:lipopolysaccharide transport system ATP-binding protein